MVAPRRAVGRLLLVLGSLGFAFLVCEVAARLLLPPQEVVKLTDAAPVTPDGGQHLDTKDVGKIDSVLVWGGPHGVRLRPNTHAAISKHTLSQRDLTIDVDSLGLRAPELGPKEKDETRVLVIGDSIVFGDFVPAEETLTGRLQALAAARHPGKKVRFINAGLPGAGTAEELYLYLETCDAVKPDLVLLGMYLNDAQTAKSFYAQSIPPPFSKSRFLTWAANRVQIVGKSLERSRSLGEIDPNWREKYRAGRDLQSGDMSNNRDAFDFEIYNAYMDFGLAWNPDSWVIEDRLLASFARETAARGTPFAVMLFPVHIQVLGSYEDYRPQKACAEICARLKVPFLDPIPTLRADWREKKDPLFYDHCHYRPHGYELLAATVLPWLEEQRLLTF
jgi:lysophospholipase L1-like esterase